MTGLLLKQNKMNIYYYTIAALIEKAQMETLLLMQNAVNTETGMPQLDEYAIADEDTGIVKKMLKTAAIKVYGMLSPYATDLIDEDEVEYEGFEFDAAYDVDNPNCVIFRINMPTTWPTQTTTLLENSIENALVNTIVGEWLKKNGADGSTHLEQAINDQNDILGYINRRTGLKRTYKLF